MNNSERIAVVTGGTKGIGRATVERFAEEEWSVATCARNEEDLAHLKQDILEKYPSSNLHVFQADLSKRTEVDDFAAFIRLLAKPVEILVNNSGVFIPGLVHEEAEGALENMINTNLYSAYHLSRALIPDMKREKHGHIFNMCSIASLHAYPNGGSYSISKFAMHGMSKALREELKDFGIRVTSVLPGAVKTASWDGVDVPEERLMKSSDIAETIYATYKLSDRTVVEDIVLRPQLGDL
ncbi:MAG: SDR family oxidoreductase [Bacteroidota bacterium]